jgi:hypothetical protein
MEDIEILVLTFAVVVSFISFGTATYIQFRNMSKTEYKGGGQSHGETSIVNYLGNMMDDNASRKKD